MLDLGDKTDSGSDVAGLVCLVRGLGGTDFDNQTAFWFDLAVLSISRSYSRSTELERPLPRINSKIH